MTANHEQCLTDEEILKLFHELEENDSATVTYQNVKDKLDSILPGPTTNASTLSKRFSRPFAAMQHQTTHPKALSILSEYYPKHRKPLSQDDFVQLVRSWEIPTQASTKASERIAESLQQPTPFLRRAKAFVSLESSQILFMAFVVSLQIAFGLWEMIMFLNNQPARHALGWGVVVAKTFAGPIYPTIFFMMLSMSRWTATLCRKIPGLRRVINWDLHRGFHIYMCCSCLLFSTLHAIAHMSGDFYWGSRPSHQAAVEALWGLSWYDTPYSKYLSILPGWSGLVALIIFWIIFLLSLPQVRNKCFEIFQMAHLLFYPFVGFLAAHGTLSLLQKPLLGYFLVIPTIIVVLERLHRTIRGFLHMPATIKALDKDTITLTIQRRWDGPWKCCAGQYILLQIPSISWWQWHPFTISSCNADTITVHIRNAGNWTKDLRRLPRTTTFCASVDGPFGAPAQQIYQFDRAIVVGSGIGVTPMSSIANDVANKLSRNKDPWRKLNRSRLDRSQLAKAYTPFTRRNEKVNKSEISLPRCVSAQSDHAQDIVDLEKGALSAEEQALSASIHEALNTQRRRVDFHWITRDPPSLQWFSDYLNRAQEAAEAHSRKASASSSSANSAVDVEPPSPRSGLMPSHSKSRSVKPSQLQFNVNTYVTAANKTVSDHVFKHLVDRFRGPGQDYSILTGLKNKSHFRRPDFSATLERYHAEMLKQGWTGGEVGVFYCGNPALGATLREACRTQTTLSWAEGSKIAYRFITEVF